MRLPSYISLWLYTYKWVHTCDFKDPLFYRDINFLCHPNTPWGNQCYNLACAHPFCISPWLYNHVCCKSCLCKYVHYIIFIHYFTLILQKWAHLYILCMLLFLPNNRLWKSLQASIDAPNICFSDCTILIFHGINYHSLFNDSSSNAFILFLFFAFVHGATINTFIYILFYF